VVAATVDWKIVGIAALLVLVAMVLAYRLLNRDPDVRSTRYGFFVERDRYTREREGWPEFDPPDARTLPQWPTEATTGIIDPPATEDAQS
jgi:hypothetical protein